MKPRTMSRMDRTTVNRSETVFEEETPTLHMLRERMREKQAPLTDVAGLDNLADLQLHMKCETTIKEQETSYMCDVLEQLCGDPDDGFDEEVFIGCEKILSHFSDEVKRSEQLRAKLRETNAAKHTDSSEMSAVRRMLVFLEFPSSSYGATVFYVFISLIVALSCITTVVETLPRYNPKVFPSYKIVWVSLDWSMTAILTAETVARFVVHVLDDSMPSSKTQNAMRFIRRPSNIVDILSLLPTYTQSLFSTGRVVSGALRTLRLLRILKFLRKFKPVRVLHLALKTAFTALIAPTLFLVLCLLLFSSALFFAEQGEYNPQTMQFELQDPQCLAEPRGFLSVYERYPEYDPKVDGVKYANFTCPDVPSKFVTIMQTVWWGIVTMPGVGFGDFYPITFFGRFITFATITFGLIFIAMPIAVIGTNFMVVMEQQDKEKLRTQAEEVMRQDEFFQMQHRLVLGERKWKQPGEEFFRKLQELSKTSQIDLGDPGYDVLMLADLLLESTVKQYVNGLLEGEERKPMFPDAHKLPLWVSETTTTPSYEINGREDGDRVIEQHVVTKPNSLIAGAGSGAAAGDPDIVVLDAATAEEMIDHRIDRNEQRAEATVEEEDFGIGQFLPQELEQLPQLRWSGISQRHAVFTTIRSWAETFVLLRNCPGCVVKVYRRIAARGSMKLSSGSNNTVQVYHLNSNVRRSTHDRQTNSVASISNKISIPTRQMRRIDEMGHHEKQEETMWKELTEEMMDKKAINFQLEMAERALAVESEHFRLHDGDIIQFGGRQDGDYSDIISGVLRQQIAAHREEVWLKQASRDAGDGPLLSGKLGGPPQANNTPSTATPDKAEEVPTLGGRAAVPPLEQLLVDAVHDCIFFRYGDNANVVQ